MSDKELFQNNFGMWLEKHGTHLGNHIEQFNGFFAIVDLNKLKTAIMQYATKPEEN